MKESRDDNVADQLTEVSKRILRRRNKFSIYAGEAQKLLVADRPAKKKF